MGELGGNKTKIIKFLADLYNFLYNQFVGFYGIIQNSFTRGRVKLRPYWLNDVKISENCNYYC